METEWCFIRARPFLDRNRLTPPLDARKRIKGTHELDGECVWWHYDTDTEFALISNGRDPSYAGCGRSKLGDDNVVCPDSGLIDAAFESVSKDDCIIFLGNEMLLTGPNKHLVFIHEEQVFESLDNPFRQSLS